MYCFIGECKSSSRPVHIQCISGTAGDSEGRSGRGANVLHSVRNVASHADVALTDTQNRSGADSDSHSV